MIQEVTAGLGRLRSGGADDGVSAETREAVADGLAQVVPQVPLVRDLGSSRRATGATIGVNPGPVPADHPHAGTLRQPGGEGIRRPFRQDINGPAGLHIGQQGAVAPPPTQRELIHAQHPRRRDGCRIGQGPDHPQQRHPAHVTANRPGHAGPGPAAQRHRHQHVRQVRQQNISNIKTTRPA
jgi:hypothetical protein